MNTDRSNVEVVYSGRSGCMCGCRGKYTTPMESAMGQLDKKVNYETMYPMW
jgi:hypothetical protein